MSARNARQNVAGAAKWISRYQRRSARLPQQTPVGRIPMIEQDHQRFRQIVKGRIRSDLRKFITRGELIGKEGKNLISIPVPGIEIPTFRYGDNSGGVGSGEGEEGQTVGQGEG